MECPLPHTPNLLLSLSSWAMWGTKDGMSTASANTPYLYRIMIVKVGLASISLEE